MMSRKQLNLIQVEKNSYYVNMDFIQELVNGTKSLQNKKSEEMDIDSLESEIPTELKNKIFPLYFYILDYFARVETIEGVSSYERKKCGNYYDLAKYFNVDTDSIKGAIEALYRAKLIDVIDASEDWVCVSINRKNVVNHSYIEKIEEIKSNAPHTFIYKFN